MNIEYQVSGLARISAGLLASITLVGLLIRFVLAAEQYGSLLAGVSHLYQFFTIVTNTLVFFVMLFIATGKSVNRIVVHASAVSIVGVGIIFHALLSHTGASEGLDGLANHITHSAVPILALAWWLAHGDLMAVKWRDSLYSLIWPSGYCVYALVRAEYSNFYPYGFIDLATLGWSGLAQSVFSLTLVFLILALLIIGFGRIVVRMRMSYQSI